MIGVELQRLLQILSPAAGAAVDGIFRALRAAERMPTAPRGRGLPVPQMRPEHAAWALLMLAVDRAPEKAVEVIEAWTEMRPSDSQTTFGTFFGGMCAILEGPLAVAEVRIGREWPYARIVLRDGREYRFGMETADEARRGGFRATPIRSELILSGGALHQIAIELAAPDGGSFGGSATIVGEN